MGKEFVALSTDILLLENFFPRDDFLAIKDFFVTNAHLFQEMPSKARVTKLDEYFHGKKKPLYYWINRKTDSWLDSLFLNAVEELVKMLSKHYGGSIDVVKDSGFRLNRYPEGHGYAYHIDQSNYTSELKERKISVVFSANDDYSGGELVFPRQGVSLKLKENSFTIFPSNYTHPHEVRPVTSGERFTFVTWLT